ncbi:hypothetical protein [Geobacter sp. SVR]|uniref:hypothetical protein n=1 Tax=Geobacter sp. SVR TaxID=2495594 RepID=UPI00143EFB4E|nr:hypothetical protein [Geobacter sp. SVR]BCS53754.1 hypothetical protein GSVR_20620 [Geobacter sp. SVR]GCF85737.1 hypothetical protein GSbR_23370 [Geobacter sp. SVR]
MAKTSKQMTVTILDQEHVRKDWFFDFAGEPFELFFSGLAKEMRKMGVLLQKVHNQDVRITVNSYADLLNAVKISSPEDGHTNQCVGHIVGKSEKLDIMDDIRTAVRRVAFAPETIAPASEFRKVCHNCGCGC